MTARQTPNALSGHLVGVEGRIYPMTMGNRSAPVPKRSSELALGTERDSSLNTPLVRFATVIRGEICHGAT